MGILLFFGIGFVLFFPLPLFVRRFGKFMPADAGTALVRSFHIPRFAKPSDTARKTLRRRLWFKLLRACVKWGLIGGICCTDCFISDIRRFCLFSSPCPR